MVLWLSGPADHWTAGPKDRGSILLRFSPKALQRWVALKARKIRDSKSALRMFRLLDDGKYIHEVTAADARAYID